MTVSSLIAGALVTGGLVYAEAALPLVYREGRMAAAFWLALLATVGSVVYTVIVLAANPRERAAALTRVGARASS